MLSPSAITTLMSCGRSSYTFSAGFERGGSWGQLKCTWQPPKPTSREMSRRRFLCMMLSSNTLPFSFRESYDRCVRPAHTLPTLCIFGHGWGWVAQLHHTVSSRARLGCGAASNISDVDEFIGDEAEVRIFDPRTSEFKDCLRSVRPCPQA